VLVLIAEFSKYPAKQAVFPLNTRYTFIIRAFGSLSCDEMDRLGEAVRINRDDDEVECLDFRNCKN
jgi:hypothetical protein